VIGNRFIGHSKSLAPIYDRPARARNPFATTAAGLHGPAASLRVGKKGAAKYGGCPEGRSFPQPPWLSADLRLDFRYAFTRLWVKLHKRCCSDPLSCRTSPKWPPGTQRQTRLLSKPSRAGTEGVPRTSAVVIRPQRGERGCLTEGMESLPDRCGGTGGRDKRASWGCHGWTRMATAQGGEPCS